MKLQFAWQSPIKLAANKRLAVSADDIGSIENVPGIYYFARSFGKNSYPFYIGETAGLRARLKMHLQSVKIVDILRGMTVAEAPVIANGARYFHFAYFVAGKGQQAAKACKIAQKMMIRKAVTDNVPLLNMQLTVIKTHDVVFTRTPKHAHYFEGEYEVEVEK